MRFWYAAIICLSTCVHDLFSRCLVEKSRSAILVFQHIIKHYKIKIWLRGQMFLLYNWVCLANCVQSLDPMMEGKSHISRTFLVFLWYIHTHVYAYIVMHTYFKEAAFKIKILFHISFGFFGHITRHHTTHVRIRMRDFCIL